jgi:CBS domain-containing protein
MNVADLIASRSDVYSISDVATVHDAARYLRERQVRAVGVVDGAGKLVGVISQADISDKVAAENRCPAWMRVNEVMERELVTVPLDTPFETCLRLMEQHTVYHLLIVDESGRFHGMLSISDLLQVIASDEKARADLLEDIIFPKR